MENIFCRNTRYKSRAILLIKQRYLTKMNSRQTILFEWYLNFGCNTKHLIQNSTLREEGNSICFKNPLQLFPLRTTLRTLQLFSFVVFPINSTYRLFRRVFVKYCRVAGNDKLIFLKCHQYCELFEVILKNVIYILLHIEKFRLLGDGIINSVD